MTQLHVFGEKKVFSAAWEPEWKCASGGPSPWRREEASPLRRGSMLWQRHSSLAVAGEAFV